jgi:hypothetical protein
MSSIQEHVSFKECFWQHSPSSDASDEEPMSMSSRVSTKAPSTCASIRPPPGLEDFGDFDAQPTAPSVWEDFEQVAPPSSSQAKQKASNLFERAFSDGQKGTTPSPVKHGKKFTFTKTRCADQLQAACETQATTRDEADAHWQAMKFQAYQHAMQFQALQTAQWYQHVAVYHTQMALMERVRKDEKRGSESTRYLNSNILD